MSALTLHCVVNKIVANCSNYCIKKNPALRDFFVIHLSKQKPLPEHLTFEKERFLEPLRFVCLQFLLL